MKTKILYASVIFLLLPIPGRTEIVMNTLRKYTLDHSPQQFCTNGVSAYYSTPGSVFNFVNIERFRTKGTINDLKILPTGSAVYALYSGRDNSMSLISDNAFSKTMLSGLNATCPRCFCFTPDAARLLAASKDCKIHIYSILNGKFKEERTIDDNTGSSSITVSPNLYYIVTASGKKVNVFNYETGKIRLSIPFNTAVRQVLFSSDGSQLFVLCEDAHLHRYDAVTFNENKQFDDLGMARSFDVTRDGKYIAVIASENKIRIINTFSPNDRYDQNIPEGGLSDVHFSTLRNGLEMLIYNTSQSLVLAELKGRAVNYTRLLEEELSTKLNVWMKRMPDEKLDEYATRVNEQTIRTQTILLQQEIATKLASQHFEIGDVEVKGYDYSNRILPIALGGIQDIYLPVPEDDILSFSKTDQLEFTMPIYIVNKEDNFELVYVEVTNKATGKHYVFDNREMKSLEYLSMDDKYVPLDVIQLSSSQGELLNEIKNSVIKESMNKSFISSHTKVNVSTDVERSYDAEGRRILNYNISLDYTVDAGFSEKEDFPSGHYLVEESGAAKALCDIISKAFENELKGYLKKGKKVIISLTGSSDASAIRNAIKYNGEFGDFIDYPAYNNGVLCNISVNSKMGIKTNDELAFIRAVGLKNFICKKLTELEEMECSFKYNIYVSEKVGAEHRRVSVIFTFPDAF